MKISVLSTSPPAAVSKNWMKWKKMEIIAQQRKENDTARHGKLGHDKMAEPRTNTVAISKCLAMQSQRSVRDPSVYLFVNEENETGNLILGLCFPIVPIATERMPLEPEKSCGT